MPEPADVRNAPRIRPVKLGASRLTLGSGPGFGIVGRRVSQRRSTGGPRHEASERVVLHGGGIELSGWTLNVSRGGVRVVLEDPVRVGDQFDVLLGDAKDPRPGRVVWIREEADGQIVGLQYTDASEPPPLPSDQPPDPPKA